MHPDLYRGPTPHRNWIRVTLLILALVAVLGVSAAAAFFVVNSTGGEQANVATSTPLATTAPSGSSSPGQCTSQSPYGFTTIHADQQLVTFYKQLNVCWVRYQYHWDNIEKSPGAYDWSQVDAAVQTMNAAGIHVDFAIQKVPDFHMTQSCLGVPFLAGPAEMSRFATLIAARYDGKHGHGLIDAFEIGNEEYDNFYIKGNSQSTTCRDASYYGPVLKAGYQAIKAANPHALVGMFGMWYRNSAHIQKFMSDLYTNGYGAYMDYMNFHFYSESDPAVTTGNAPSFDEWWQMIHNIAAQYGYPNKPIWVTEIGWPTSGKGAGDTGFVSPQTQARYLQYIMNDAARSGVIQRVFWFTLNYGHQSDNIYPPTGPLPAFQTFQSIVQSKPLWR